MPAQEYVTVWDVTQKGFEWWWPAIALGFTIFFSAQAWVQRKNFFKTHSMSSMMLFCALFAGFLFVLIAWSGYDEFSFIRRAYSTGNYDVAEGAVGNFRAASYGAGQECFSVQDTRFCYSQYRIGPSFNHTASHGGPIRAGLPVRIAYLESRDLERYILRIEVRADALSQTKSFVPGREEWEASAEEYRSNSPMVFGFTIFSVYFCAWAVIEQSRFIKFFLWKKSLQERYIRFYQVFWWVSLAGAIYRLIEDIVRRPRAGQFYLEAFGISFVFLAVWAGMVKAVEFMNRVAIKEGRSQ